MNLLHKLGLKEKREEVEFTQNSDEVVENLRPEEGGKILVQTS